ncbi:hypothetical protein DV735_g3868, partial [Chaetothyriales sp. CBS 134920]
MFRTTASRALPRSLRLQAAAKTGNAPSKLLRAHLQTYASQRTSSGLLAVALREPLKRSVVQYRSITSYQSPSFVKGRNVEEEAEIGRATLQATPETVSLASTTSGAGAEIAARQAVDDHDDVSGGIKAEFQTIVDTFTLKDVPKEALVVGLAGVLPYLATSLSTVYLSWDIQYAAHHGQGFILSAETAERLLHLIEPIELGYGASIISFLGAIHWGLEWAGYGGNQGYSRYAIGIIATAVAWPTILLPAELGLIAQFLAFSFLYFADARASVRGWAPPWYATYRFVLTFVVGASIVASLVGRGQIADLITRPPGPADRMRAVREAQLEDLEASDAEAKARAELEEEQAEAAEAEAEGEGEDEDEE